MQDKAFAVEGDDQSTDRSLLEDESTNDSNSSPKKHLWKYVMFFLIWTLSAWHLLTVKEKVLIKHDVHINENISRSMDFIEINKVKIH